MNSDLPLVSVLIPAYNPRFFEQALKSAVDQDYHDLEIIVSDDSAGDEIARICERLNDGRVAYIKNPKNLGFCGNFTQCFNLAKGTYLKFLNDDDALLPSCVSRMVNEFEKYGDKLILVTSRRRVINEQGVLCNDIHATTPLAHVTGYMEGRALGDFVLVHSTNFIGEPTTVMFRKRDVEIQDNNMFVLNGNEYICLADLSLWLRLLSKGEAIYIAEPMSLFRIHPNQQQNKADTAYKCVTERFFLVQDARTLGFLQSPELYRRAMSVVANRFHAALADPNLDLEIRKKLHDVRRQIPEEFFP